MLSPLSVDRKPEPSQRRCVPFPGLWHSQDHSELFSFAYFCPFPLKCGLLAVRGCFCINKKEANTWCYYYCYWKKNVWKKHLLWSLSKDFVPRSYLQRNKSRVQPSLCESRERGFCAAVWTFLLSLRSRGRLSSDCVWPSVKLNENLSE